MTSLQPTQFPTSVQPDPNIHNVSAYQRASSLPSAGQLEGWALQFIEGVVQEVVTAILGFFLPGSGTAVSQLFHIFNDLLGGVFGGIGGLGTGSPTLLSGLDGIPILGPLLDAFLTPVEGILGGPLGGGQNPIGGFFSIFTDFLGIFGMGGSSTGLGSGNPTLPGVGSIPFLGPLFNTFIGFFSGSGSGLGGLSTVFDDFLGIFGSPGGLGTGSPTLPGIGSIPFFGPLIDEFISLFGGTGSGLGTLSNVFGDFLGLFGNPTGLGTGTVTLPPMSQIGLLGSTQNMFEAQGKALGNAPGGPPISSTSMQGLMGSVATTATSALQTAAQVGALQAVQSGANNSNRGVGGVAVSITPSGAPGAVWT